MRRKTISPLVIDIIIIAVLLFSALIAFMRGFVKEVLTIFSLVGASLSAFMGGGHLSPWVKTWSVGLVEEGGKGLVWGLIPHEIFVGIVAYGAVFALVFIILSVISYFIGKVVQGVGLGAVDRSLGFVFGLARGLIIVALINIPVVALLGENDKPIWLKESKAMIFVDRTSEIIMALDPSGLMDSSEKNVVTIKKSSEDLKIRVSPEEHKQGYSEKDRDTLDNLIEQIEK